MVAVVCSHARSYYLRAFFGAFVTVTFPYTVQYTLFALPLRPPKQKLISISPGWNSRPERKRC